MTAQKSFRFQTSGRHLEGGFSGQALIIILLVLAVSGTIVLSLVSRTITDITVTTKEKESARAFSAAEAGVEKALVTGTGETGILGGGETYNVTVGVLGGTRELVGPELRAGDTFPIWFVSHAEDGSLTCSGQPCFTGSSLTICWGQQDSPSGSSTTPAIEAFILYTTSPGNYATARVARGAYDPNASRRGTNRFDAPDPGSCLVGGRNFAFWKTINFGDFGIASGTPNVLQTGRIKFIYNTDVAHQVGVSTPSDLPQQGKRITSVGSLGEATRKIEVIQSFPDLPPIFDFGLFTTGSLTK